MSGVYVFKDEDVYIFDGSVVEYYFCGEQSDEYDVICSFGWKVGCRIQGRGGGVLFC